MRTQDNFLMKEMRKEGPLIWRLVVVNKATLLMNLQKKLNYTSNREEFLSQSKEKHLLPSVMVLRRQ